MATDIFNRTIGGVGNSFSADQAVLTFAGTGVNSADLAKGDTPLLVQNFTLSFQQPVTMLFDMSSPKLHFVRGRSSGQGQIGQIFGPAKLQSAFLKAYGNVCNVANNRLQFTILAACNQGGLNDEGEFEVSQTLECSYVVLNSIGFSGTAQDMMINQSVGFMFGALSSTEPGA